MTTPAVKICGIASGNEARLSGGRLDAARLAALMAAVRALA